MKTIYFKKFLLLITLGLIVFACKELGSIDPGKDLKLILNYKPADSFIEAQIKDAVSGDLISSNINIEIVGAQAANVINFEGEAKSKYTKKGPSFYIGFQNIFPSLTNPIKLKVLISADGYLSNSRDILLTDVENPPVEIALVKIDSPPAGSAIKQANISVTTSGASQATTLEVVNQQKATLVAINQGTIMKDSQGNVVTGNLTSTVATFSGTSAEAAPSFPGGNAAVLAKDIDGKTNVSATLVPIAFADISIKSSGGAEVTSFTKPISISFEVDPNTINPTTNLEVKVGDSFSVYSYSNATAVWTYDKEGTIISKNGKLFVSFESNHLTWFYIGYTYRIPNSVQINLTVDGAPNNSANGRSLSYYALIKYNIGRFTYSAYYTGAFYATNSTPLKFTSTIYSSGVVQSMEARFYHPFTGKYTILTVPNPNSGLANLNVPYGVVSTTKLKTVNITVSCENKCALQILPYNVGIEYNNNINANLSGTTERWIFAGNVNYDKTDNKIKLRAYLPDNTNLLFRAIAYPEYPKQINTGTGDSFEAPIILPKTHPLCNCGK